MADSTTTSAAASSSQQQQSTSEGIVSETLDRLTRGIPKDELRLCISEANECETALQRDITLLEKALTAAGEESSSQDKKNNDNDAAIEEMLASPFTPLDRFWTASALLGRLRGPMAPPSLLQIRHPTTTTTATTNKQGTTKSTSPLPKNTPAGATTSPEAQNLLQLLSHPAYTRTEPTATILACWKKIFTHRLAFAFKKPVKDEEAPGYSDRIRFPMDLSLIRKMIITRNIASFQQLHVQLALITHNCLKYNGRETDYGNLARDFEAMVDDTIRLAVMTAAAETAKAGATASSGNITENSSKGERPSVTLPSAATSTGPVPPSIVSEDSTKMDLS